MATTTEQRVRSLEAAIAREDALLRALHWARISADPHDADAPTADALRRLENDGLVRIQEVIGGNPSPRILVQLTGLGRYELDRLGPAS